eukprot:2095064-Prorocentrum_lima.AAC.1
MKHILCRARPLHSGSARHIQLLHALQDPGHSGRTGIFLQQQQAEGDCVHGQIQHQGRARVRTKFEFCFGGSDVDCL